MGANLPFIHCKMGESLVDRSIGFLGYTPAFDSHRMIGKTMRDTAPFVSLSLIILDRIILARMSILVRLLVVIERRPYGPVAQLVRAHA